MIDRADRFIGKYMALFVLGCMALGVLYSEELSFVRNYLTIYMALITFINSLGGGVNDIKNELSHPGKLLIGFLIIHLVMPVFALFAGNVMLSDTPDYIVGLVLEYTIPTAVSSLVWIGISGANLHLGLAMVLLDTILAPFIVPLSLKFFVGTIVEIQVLGIMKSLVYMVVLPAILGVLVFESDKGKTATALKNRLKIIPKLMIMLVAVGNATGCASYIRNLDLKLCIIILLVFALGIIAYGMGFIVCRFLRLPNIDTAALTINCGMRNNGLGSTLAIKYFSPDVLFIVAFAPLYSQLSASIATRVMQRYFKICERDVGERQH